MSEFLDRISNLPPKRLALLALELQTKLEELQAASTSVLHNEPIAVIGMACRFPRGADTPEAFWELLRNGTDCISRVPTARWDVEALYDPNPDAIGKMTTRWGGFLDDVDQFDPEFFGISPREANRMDPQQRFALELCWHALENAGYAPDQLAGSLTGVFMGICNEDYYQIQLNGSSSDPLDLYSVTGNAHSIVSGRVSYLLGLQGPSLSVDTACSASLVAVHLAIQSLRSGECRLALAGGINLILTPDTTIALSRAGMMAPDGRCKAFDASGDGFVRSEGCAVIALKRLSAAQEDGDTILAVLRGSAVNQDGRSNGLTAPNGLAQQAVIRAALANANVTPDQISYVETHGTGTSLGDPIEVQALGAVLGPERAVPLMLGSVKTNVGHTEATAGIAGLMKTILSIRHKQIPPHLHLKQPNPFIPWESIPVTVPTQLTSWESPKSPRRAAVSSFGFSGTNAVVVVEQAPSRTAGPQNTPTGRPLHILTLAAKNENALQELATRYSSYLAANSTVSFSDIAHTSHVARAHFNHRLAVIASDSIQAANALSQFASGQAASNVLSGSVKGTQVPGIAFLFTGQGSQYVGMGRQLYESEPTFRRAIHECNELVQPYLGESLLTILYPSLQDGDASAKLRDIFFAQPAVFAVEYALAELFKSWGITPNAVIGHSIGEYTAACVAGVLTLGDAVRLLCERTRLMQTTAKGEMATVFAPAERVNEFLAPYANQVSLAAVNTPDSVVISGERTAVQNVLAAIQRAGIHAQRLPISIAAHSPLMDPILDAFAQVASEISFKPPGIEYVSGMTGEIIGSDEITSPLYWRRQLRETVRFAAGAATLYAQGYPLVVEIGPSPTLIGMAQRCIQKNAIAWIPSLRPGHDDFKQLFTGLSTLYVNGINIDWNGYAGNRAYSRVPIPTYPFQRKRCWITSTPNGQKAAAPGGHKTEHALLGNRLDLASIKEIIYETSISLNSFPFLRDHRVHGLPVLPSPIYIEAALAAATEQFGPGAHSVQDLMINKPLVLAEGEVRRVQIVVNALDDQAAFQISSYSENMWHSHAEGTLHAGHAGQSASPVNLTEIQARCTKELPVPEFYNTLQNLGLEFGVRFRGLAQIWRRDGEALGLLQMPDELRDQANTFQPVHPALMDACFHLLGAALPNLENESGEAFILFGAELVRFYGSPGERFWAHVQVDLENLQANQHNTSGISGSLQLLTQEGQVIAGFKGLELRLARRDAFVGAIAFTRAPDKDIGKLFYEVTWREQPHSIEAITQTNNLMSTPATRAAWILFADRQGVGDKLADQLISRGESCVVVRYGSAYLEQHDGEIVIDPASRDDIEHLFDRISEIGQVPCQGIVYLWALDSHLTEANTDADLERSQTLFCAGPLHLLQSVTTKWGAQPPRLWIVTRGAQCVDAPHEVRCVNESDENVPGQATLWGLNQVIAAEHPELYSTCIDLDITPSTSDIPSLLAEIGESDPKENQVAFRNETRFVRRLARAAAKLQTPAEPFSPFKPDATYLLTGGLGGIGLLVAKWMVERGARHLVLMGRRAPLPDALETIKAMEESGAQILAAQGDVSRQESLAHVLAQIEHSMPPLRGIMHIAAAVDDGVLLQQNWARFRSVLAPKVMGAWNLHTLTRTMELDFVVFFSSGASLIGLAGEGNYAAANAFLDAFAYYRQSHKLAALTVNWGAWAGVGLSAKFDVEKRRDVEGMSPQEGLAALELAMARQLQTGQPRFTQVAIMPGDWHRLARQFRDARVPPFLSDVIKQGDDPEKRKEPTLQKKRGHLAQQMASASTDTRSEILTEHLSTDARQILGLEHPVDIHTPLTALGLDSLMAVELRNRITHSLTINVPMTLFLEGCSVSDLTLQVLSRFNSLQESESNANAKPREQATSQNAQELLAHIDELSQEQVDSLLNTLLQERSAHERN